MHPNFIFASCSNKKIHLTGLAIIGNIKLFKMLKFAEKRWKIVRVLNKAIICFIIIVLLLLSPMYVFAMDTAFVSNPEIWYEKNGICHGSEQKLENYSGMFSYYTDVENNCFYLHISYNEKSLNDEGNDIKVEFCILNDINTYSFTFDEAGIIEADSEIKKSFDAICNFGQATAQGQEIYLGIEFRNKADKAVDNTVSFSVAVNGKAYKLADGITLPFCKEEATKTESKERTSSAKETKKNSNINTESRSSKASTEKTTKFRYIAPQKPNNSEEYTAEEYTFTEDNIETPKNNAEIITEEQDKSSISSSSKILIAAAVFSILIGTAMIVYYSLKAKKDKSEKQDEQ